MPRVSTIERVPESESESASEAASESVSEPESVGGAGAWW